VFWNKQKGFDALISLDRVFDGFPDIRTAIRRFQNNGVERTHSGKRPKKPVEILAIHLPHPLA
jgi:hypothetical protein